MGPALEVLQPAISGFGQRSLERAAPHAPILCMDLLAPVRLIGLPLRSCFAKDAAVVRPAGIGQWSALRSSDFIRPIEQIRAPETAAADHRDHHRG